MQMDWFQHDNAPPQKWAGTGIRYGGWPSKWQHPLSCTPRVRHSSTDTEVKTEAEIIEKTGPAASGHLPEVTAAFRVLKDVMYPTCVLHNVDFQKPGELHELEQMESIQGFADFVLADLP